MDYLSVQEWADLHSIPVRTVRNYCAKGKIKGYLMDTCLTAQDFFKLLLEKFRIKYD